MCRCFSFTLKDVDVMVLQFHAEGRGCAGVSVLHAEGRGCNGVAVSR